MLLVFVGKPGSGNQGYLAGMKLLESMDFGRL